MSSKKDKLIEEAQRMALRGQLDKAIKAYQQVMQLDPSAINQRQKLAELLVRANRTEDAKVEYEAIGTYYTTNGFYLKAIAVYKKLQVMFPADIAVTLNLATLNERHGLVANALAEYKQVYDYYENASNTAEALKILERMQSVDKQNVGIKLKLAEAYFDAGKKEESYAAFARLATLLRDRKDTAGFRRLNERIQKLFPERSEFMLEVLSAQVEEGNAASAIDGLQSLLRANPHDIRVWNLLITSFRQLNQPQKLKIASQHFLQLFPDELLPRKVFLECLVADRDVNGALEALDRHERHFLDGAAVGDLLGIYTDLERMAPDNQRILEGLKRVYEFTGDAKNLAVTEARMAAMRQVSGKQPSSRKTEEKPACSEVLPQEPVAEPPVAPPVTTKASGGKAKLPVEPVTPAGRGDLAGASGSFDFDGDTLDEIEIEVELEAEGMDELPLSGEIPAEVAGDAWLDSVGEIFDAIATSPRSVKFGNDLETSDAQSHYDLGVAFKEMGLYDEAISEFRQAADDPARRVECFVLQGACLREKGDVPTAESVLRSLLNPGLSLEESCMVKYELALTCEMLIKNDEAAALLAEIDAAKPGFRDVRSRLDVAQAESSLDFSDEDLLGFDLK